MKCTSMKLRFMLVDKWALRTRDNGLQKSHANTGSVITRY